MPAKITAQNPGAKGPLLGDLASGRPNSLLESRLQILLDNRHKSRPEPRPASLLASRLTGLLPARLLPLLVLIFCLFIVAGCASREVSAPTPEEVKAASADFDRHLGRSTFEASDAPYVSGHLVPLQSDKLDTALMRTRVTLRQKGSLEDIAASLSKLAPVTVHVAREGDIGSAAHNTGHDSPALSGNAISASSLSQDEAALLPDLLPASMPLPDLLDISYTGTLRGLLELIASQSGYGFDYDEQAKSVTFSAMQVRTFVLSALTGQIAWESSISNKSRGTKTTSQNSSNINSTVSGGDSQGETAQTNTTKTALDIWADTEKSVRMLLSKEGTCSVNQAAGTITVRDTYARMRIIEKCISQINARLERQVAMRVHVYALEVNDTSSFNAGMKALFTSPDAIVEAGSAAQAASDMAGVSIVKGSLAGSAGFLEALNKWGRATQLTSASGLVLNNQPFPVQAIRRHAYLAGMTRSTTQYDQSTEITPGEVTTGFAMTIVPHVLPDSHVLLQYSITLSSLEGMTNIEKDNVYVQLPQVATRAFSQRTRLKRGQTLMLAGFEQDAQEAQNSVGFLHAGRSADAKKTLLVISIELEGADNV
ncbi:MAG: pilus assembly protein [Desulfovibrionaceae bacterium]|nr:pilus assembly protein [Desulfovibrionaceae bacterium]